MASLDSKEAAASVLRKTLFYARKLLLPMEVLATASFLTAYAVSRPRLRHPYILYAAFGGLGVLPVTKFLMADVTKRLVNSESQNGEELRRDLQQWKLLNLGRAAVSGYVTNLRCKINYIKCKKNNIIYVYVYV